MEGYRITLGARELFQNTLPPFSPCPLRSGYLVWNLSLGMVPEPIARYHFFFLIKKIQGLPMPRVHVHVHIDKIVFGIQ